MSWLEEVLLLVVSGLASWAGMASLFAWTYRFERNEAERKLERCRDTIQRMSDTMRRFPGGGRK